MMNRVQEERIKTEQKAREAQARVDARLNRVALIEHVRPQLCFLWLWTNKFNNTDIVKYFGFSLHTGVAS